LAADKKSQRGVVLKVFVFGRLLKNNPDAAKK
jgi:hypothetical protein